MTSTQTTFRYRLQRVLQLREMETATCAAQLRGLALRLHQLGEQVDGKQQAIQVAQQSVIQTEGKSGAIDPGYRMRVVTYIDLAQQQQQALVTQRLQTSQELAAARSALLLKRQAQRGLEIHRQHGSEAFSARQQGQRLRQEDELWLLSRHAQAHAQAKLAHQVQDRRQFHVPNQACRHQAGDLHEA
jgi:hypothetical protein